MTDDAKAELEERLAVTEEEWDKEHEVYRDRIIGLEAWVKKAIPVLRKSMRILRMSDFTNVGQEAGQLLIDDVAVGLDDQEDDDA